MALCAEVGSKWATQAEKVVTAFQGVSDLARTARAAWINAINIQKKALETLDSMPEKYNELRINIAANIDEAESNQLVWKKKADQSERNKIDAQAPQISEIKTAIFQARKEWGDFSEISEKYFNDRNKNARRNETSISFSDIERRACATKELLQKFFNPNESQQNPILQYAYELVIALDDVFEFDIRAVWPYLTASIQGDSERALNISSGFGSTTIAIKKCQDNISNFNQTIWAYEATWINQAA